LVAKQAIKAQQKPDHGKRTASAALIDEDEVVETPAKGKSASTRKYGSNKKHKRFDEGSWPWTHEVPTAEAIAKNLAKSGRNVIQWQRKSKPPHLVE